MPVSDDKIQRAYRIRISIFLLCAALIVVGLSTVYQAIQTLNRLEVVEHDRDQWQRPADIMQALDLREGSVVADIGPERDTSRSSFHRQSERAARSWLSTFRKNH